MRITLIDVPYDSGRQAERMGRGPAVLAAALPPALAAAGHDVETRAARLPSGFVAEVAAVIGLQRIVRDEVGAARESGRLPVVLSGNCGYAALGATAALGPGTAVLWLDAHADFNTPETSPSGFFDGTSLAALCGRAWTGVARSFAGFTPVPESAVVLLGARDLDDEERRMLLGSEVSWVRPGDLRADGAALASALDGIAGRAERLYLHLDLDVIDPGDLRANVYSCPGGLTVDDIVAAIAAAGERLPIAAVGVTAYDPQVDVAGCGPAVAVRLVDAVIAASSELPA
jgi:arginase